jgi:hypothetical protein
LTRFEAHEALQNIRLTDREFWDELEARMIRALEKHNGKFSDNPDPMSNSLLDNDELLDRCEISSRRVKQAMMQSAMEPLSSENNSAETLDDVEVAQDSGDQTTEKTVGKGVRKLTTRYEGFWCHRDNVSWESDEDFS